MKTKHNNNDARARGNWQGMNWCRPSTRLALYLRDGMVCAWCGASLEDGAQLTLDHIVPHGKGGTNDARNLVTSCHRCNSVRGDRSVPAFARAVATYLNHGVNPDDIVAHVRNCARRSMTQYRAEARETVARRGTVKAALNAMY